MTEPIFPGLHPGLGEPGRWMHKPEEAQPSRTPALPGPATGPSPGARQTLQHLSESPVFRPVSHPHTEPPLLPASDTRRTPRVFAELTEEPAAPVIPPDEPGPSARDASPLTPRPHPTSMHHTEPIPTREPAYKPVPTAAQTPAPANTPKPPQTHAAPAPKAAPAPVRTAARQPQASGFQRAVGMVRTALPVLQKLLPLLEGNVASAVVNVLAPRPMQPPTPSIDLAPVENALTRLNTEQRELRGQLTEQNASIQRVADQLGMVKEATDRNTLEQQELMEDLKGIRRKVVFFAWGAIVLLAISIAGNVLLFLRMEHIVR